jgi:uncharacterized protein
MIDIALAVGLGFLAGLFSGLLGIGGGALFVPALALGLGLSQLGAQATSLAAMIPVLVVGAWRHTSYGNVLWRPALVIGAASAGGVVSGAFLARALPDHVLRQLFALFLVCMAARMVWVWHKRRARASARTADRIRPAGSQEAQL